MVRWVLGVIAAMVVLALGYGAISQATARVGSQLELYTSHVSPQQLRQLATEGYDIAGSRPAAGGFDVQLVLTGAQRDLLTSSGYQLQTWRNPKGLTANQMAAVEQQAGYVVWRPYDGEAGIQAEMLQLAADHPDLAETTVIGQSVQGRDIVAVRITKDVSTVAEGTRPAVLYSSLQHAREWIGLEVARRLMHHYVDQYGVDPDVTRLVDSREFWFVLVANPDGYQLTFEPGLRMWRKNARDNNEDGVFDADNDGVDPNRNFDAHWGYDAEGADLGPGDTTYRGTEPASEPETRAMQGLLQRVHFEFQVNYHSVAELLLRPEGWQDQTPSVDDAIFVALSGTPANSAIPGSTPVLSAGLYITNGETCDYAYIEVGTLCWTPELSDGGSGGGFVFPDDEDLVQKEFENNLPFALDVAESAGHPAEPASHLGNTVQAMYPSPFAISYGDPQVVQVNAQRQLGEVTLRWRVNDGPEQSATTAEWAGGERYGASGSVHYHKLRGEVRGAQPGDTVAVWFAAGATATEPFTYTLEQDTDAPVLVLAAEDYTGILPEYVKQDGPSYLEAYQVALDEAGLAADMYDVDAHGRTAPSALGILAHYRAVVWYTGDDVVPRGPGMGQGTVDAWANDLQLAVRDYLNEGGKLLYTGKHAGTPYFGGYNWSPDPADPCDPNNRSGTCEDLRDDFLQYYLAAYRNVDNAGTAPEGKVLGVAPNAGGPFDGLTIDLGGASGADNQDHSMGLIATSRELPADTYPQFASQGAAYYQNPALAPHTGERDVYSGYTDLAFQRLSRTVDLTGAISATLGLWISHQTATSRGYVFVEAHTVGQDDWTTLPDASGHTAQSLPGTCPTYVYAHLEHYMTQEGLPFSRNARCLPTGTSGAWHAATGDSHGWVEWSVDLSAFAGREVEVVVSHVANGTRLGWLVDDVTLTVDGVAESTSFEDGLDGWTIQGAPEGSSPNTIEASLAGADAVPISAIVTTEDTVYMGFGFEAIATVAQRTDVMCRAMDHLLGGNLPCAHPVKGPQPLYLPWSYAK